jgi:hypothetical protein
VHIDGQCFLITVCTPLQITLHVYIKQESQGGLGSSLQGQLELSSSKIFKPVHTDQQSVHSSLETKFENVMIDIGGVGGYLPKVW